MGSYFDTTTLTENQKAAFDAAVQDLLRSDDFRQVLENAYEQYGTISVTLNPELRTGINAIQKPARLNINPDILERIFLVKKEGTKAIAAPFTLQRAIAHEMFHLGFDKDQTKNMQFRRFADMVQTAVSMSRRPPIEREIARDWSHFMTFFGYDDVKSFTDDLLSEPNPMSAREFEAQIERPAIRFANKVLKSLHPDGFLARDEGSHTRQSGLIGVAFKTLMCKTDQPAVFQLGEALKQANVQDDTEPCAYVHIPGKQQSLVRD